jgi:hypothetical protein
MSGKRKKKEKRVAGGVPLGDISLSLRSNLDSLFGWIETIGAGARSAARDHLSGHLLETIDRLCDLAAQKKDRVAGQRAAQALSVLVYRCINPLIGIGSAKQVTGGQLLAGESLMRVRVVIEKHNERLRRVNSAYRETEAKIRKLKLRRDIVADPGVIGQIVQKELATAERYRDELLFYRRLRLLAKNRKSLIRTRISSEYWPAMKLPEFSVKSEPQWWEFLWPLLKKNNPDLLEKLRGDAKRKEVVWTHLDGSSNRQVKSRKLFWKDFQKQFRNHLKALAGQRVR